MLMTMPMTEVGFFSKAKKFDEPTDEEYIGNSLLFIIHMPTIKSIICLLSTTLLVKADLVTTKTLDDFDSTRVIGNWMTVNDGVMGGLSKGGSVVSKKNTLMFNGKISLQNNGGFSSVRTSGKTHDLSAYTGIELKVKGDGRKYYLTTRTGGNRMLAYWSPIQPAKGEWAIVRIPFKSFYATYFGNKVPTFKLNTKKVSSVGFMLYDKKDGDFQIEVESIKVYKK